MANWKEYTTKTTPEDADEIMIADSKANVSKRTPFSGLWNWIAGKLATAVISQLETQNKSIIPALNELNSNRSISILKEAPGGDKILFFYTGSSSIVLNEKGSKIPSWSFCIYLPFNANGDGALLAIGSNAFGYTFRSSGVWRDFIEK